ALIPEHLSDGELNTADTGVTKVRSAMPRVQLLFRGDDKAPSDTAEDVANALSAARDALRHLSDRRREESEAAFQAALREAEGKYTAFLDDVSAAIAR